MLPDTLDARIAVTISDTIDGERASADTSSPVWRERCEVARVAQLSDSERHIFLSHVAEHRGPAVASGLERSASQMRTTAIFFLARKPS